MARCPECRKHFRVLDDEDPADFGCSYCGYGRPPEFEFDEPDEDEDASES